MRTVEVLSCLSLAVFLSACVTTGKVVTDPDLVVDSGGSGKAAMRLPKRYMPEVDFTSAVVFVKDIGKIGPVVSVMDSSDPEVLNREIGVFTDDRVNMEVQTEIESRLHRLKRFNIVRSFSRDRALLKGEMEAYEAGDELAYDVDDTGAINHIIALELTRSRDVQQLSNRQDMALFRATLAYQVIRIGPGGGEVLESGAAEGRAKRFKVYDIHWNRKRRQYDKTLRQGEADFDVEQAHLQAICRASLVLVDRIGRAFPVSGRVLRWAADHARIDAGERQGVVRGQLFVLHTFHEGEDTPFALARAVEVDEDRADLRVSKWSSSPFVRPVVAEMKGGGAENLRIHAVSKGLPEGFFSVAGCGPGG